MSQNKKPNIKMGHSGGLICIYASKTYIWPARVVFLLIASYFLFEVFAAYDAGEVTTRRGKAALDESPSSFMIKIMYYIAFASMSLLLAFRVKFRELEPKEPGVAKESKNQRGRRIKGVESKGSE